MSAMAAAFPGSGRRVWATVAPPTTVNRDCYRWRNLLQLRTLRSATVASATGHVWTAPAVQEESDYQRSVRVRSCIRPLSAAVWPLALM
jgi:hypothetical protein